MLNYDLTKFIDDGVCREERQYAVFLYNIFLERKRKDAPLKPETEKIIRACLTGSKDYDKEIKIEAVYYEATFMRDFFMHDRSRILEEKGMKRKDIGKALENLNDLCPNGEYFTDSFNHKLLTYCVEHDDSIINKEGISRQIIEKIRSHGYLLHNWGNKEVSALFKNDDKQSGIMAQIKRMMNSKPDMAVIFSVRGEDSKKILRLIECKYLSKEYKKDGETQRRVQDGIANFLCSISPDLKVSPVHLPGNENRIIKFTDKMGSDNENETEIPLDFLKQMYE